jgi:hypothetical protein
VKNSAASARSYNRPAYSVSRKGGKETLWKNSLNFLKDVPMICVNLIVIVVSEKKIGGVSFVTPLVPGALPLLKLEKVGVIRRM